MLYDMGLLQGLAQRRSEPKFRAVFRWIALDTIDPEYLKELAVLLHTRGFALEHHAWAFGWFRPIRNLIVPQLVEATKDDDGVQAAAQANGDSITMGDGIDYLMAMRAVKPGYGGSVPLWTTLALQQWRAEGATSSEVAHKIGATSIQVQRWWSEQRFDPLTGLELLS